ncbi:hypothetical protein [Marinobacter sp.]|uniref:hypothetical protein n=1 Tax=Marinobacter sp. TaxID=50741 RepID=UPI0019DB6353|nr:hypothetical protein [Marinobacter sp.]MBE0486332.1 hypothetical protein [Marinobacter sp.]
MCQATRDILWEQAKNWIREQNQCAGLVLRVGSGQATYHRYDPTRKQHLINYGARMIAAKHQPETAQGWLSTREIRSRGYFGGEVSVLNLLAHTCCHEFAHLLQHSAGQRHYGSVHNRHFYEALDELHTSGAAHATRQHLSEQAAVAGIELPGSAFELPNPVQARQQWQVGDAVRFGDGRSKKKGEVIRVNRKTCTVLVNHQSRLLRYRVPLQLLSPAT